MKFVFGCIAGLCFGAAAAIVTGTPLVGFLVVVGTIAFLASIDLMFI